MPELGDWAVDLAGSPWVLLVLYAVVAVDGVLPPVPSESAVVVLAAMAAAGGSPSAWLVGVVAAAGAFTGDQAAYWLGRRFPVRRTRAMRSDRAQDAVAWAEDAFAHRGAAVVIGARFVPVGRVAVNVTAGSVGLSRARFSAFAAVAAVLWASCSVVLGVGAAHLLDGRPPVLGAAVGVVGGLVSGVVVDRVVRRVARGRAAGHAPASGAPSRCVATR